MGAAAQRLDQGRMTFERVDSSTLVVHLSGPWHLQRDLPPTSLLAAELGARPGARRLAYETAQLTHWDSGLISFLTNAAEICRARGITEDRAGLPAGLRRLLELAEAVPVRAMLTKSLVNIDIACNSGVRTACPVSTRPAPRTTRVTHLFTSMPSV